MANSNTPVVRIARLLQIIQELQLRPKQTPQELCVRLGIKRSTFHNDKKALAEAGFSWHYDRQRKVYFREGDTILPLLEITFREALAMVLAVRQFSATGDSALAYDAVEGIKKLIAATSDSSRKLLSGALDDILRSTFHSAPSIINALVEAQKQHRYLAISYDDRSKKRVMLYEVAPYQIFFQGRALYVDTYIREENRIATLRINRIKQIKEFRGGFEVLPSYNFIDRHKYTFRAIRSDNKPQKVRLLFDPTVASLIWESRWHSTEKKMAGADGSIILELTVSYPQEVLWYLVMPYAEHVEILEPKWLSDQMYQIASNIVAKSVAKQR